MKFPSGCKYEFHSDIRNAKNSRFKIGGNLNVFYIRMTDVSCDVEQEFIFSMTIHYLNPRLWVSLIIVFFCG